MAPEVPPARRPIDIASVVRGLGGGGAVRITVHGTWRVAAPEGRPVLLVDDGGRRHVIPALPAEPPGDPTAFRADFDLPPALAGVSGDGLVLSVCEAEIVLPEALPGVPPVPVRDVTAQAPADAAEVFDRAVLAEHRARRAEQGLEGLGERLRTLEAHLAEVTEERDRLREELQTARGNGDESAALLAAAQSEAAALRAELDVIRAERDGLREAVARVDRSTPHEPAAGLAELGETARALREHAEDELAARAPAEEPAERDPFDVALAELRARTRPAPEEVAPGTVIPFDPLRNTMNLAAMSPGRRARSRLRRVAPEDRRPVHGDSLEAVRRSGVPWLSGAIGLLAADDVRAAGLFLLSLLPDAARTFDGDLTFDVDIDAVGPHRVTLRDGAGSVVALGEGATGDAEFRIGGPAGLLAPLGAGGAPRRLGGARVSGSRRALRRLLKARRAPVDLGDLAAAGVVPEPALLLRVLAAAVRPSWTGEDGYAVAVDVPDREPITVVSEPGKRLQVVGAPPSGGAVRAVLTSSPAALLALLGRVEPPEGDDAWLSGEEAVMTTLLELLDRAQGLPSRY